MSSRSAFVALFACLAVGLAVAAAWWWNDRPLAVELVHPTRGPAVDLVYATGFAEPARSVSVSTRLTAPVMSVLVDEGDRVRRGQPLLRLDDHDLQGAFAETRAQSAGATLAEVRANTLFGQGWITRAARDAAVATGQAARAADGAASARLDQAVVRAGIDGVVTKRDIEPGELATPGRVLMMLGDPAHLRVTATVDERDISRVRPGQLAWLSNDGWPGRRLRARVAAITPIGDPSQRAYRVRLTPKAGISLPLGMTFEVNIVTRQSDRALLVPTRAVTTSRVWTAVAGRARLRPVALGIVGPDRVEVVSGLGPGDVIVDHPPPDLHDGQRLEAMR